MLKRIISGLIAITMLTSIGSTAVFADDTEREDISIDSYHETDDEILPDGEDDYSLSTNIMLQELLQEVEEAEQGTRWGGGSSSSTHGIIAKACMSEFGSDYTQSQLQLIEDCLVYGAYKADTKDLHHRKRETKVPTTGTGSFYPLAKTVIINGERYYDDTLVGFHAVPSSGTYGNYLKYLKCLWKYAKQVSQVTYSNGVYNDDSLVASIKASVNVSQINTEEDDIDQLLYGVHFIFYHYAAKNNLNRALTNTEKKYLVIGLGLHLIGDIYAHRGCVPSIYASDSYFNSYINNNGYIKASKISQLKSLIGQGNFYCTKFYNNNENNSYIDMVTVHADHPDWSGNDVYEDNVNFLPQRYYISILASQNFVSEILISGNTYSASDIVLNNYSCPTPISYPVQYYYEALSLYNYSTYLNDL